MLTEEQKIMFSMPDFEWQEYVLYNPVQVAEMLCELFGYVLELLDEVENRN